MSDKHSMCARLGCRDCTILSENAPTIPPAVSAARSACEALADRLRRGADASLETADACAALRELAAAWALVLPRLPEDVTPPEWPRAKGSVRNIIDPGKLAGMLDDEAVRGLEFGERCDIADALEVPS